MLRPLAVLVLVAWCTLSALAEDTASENWPGWRGPRGDGSSLEQDVATEWDGPSGKNIAWKSTIPGGGHSSPIVWNEKIFLATFVEGDDAGQQPDRLLLCLDRKTGKELWRKTVIDAPKEKKHTLNSYASGTPVTDGELVYVTFLLPDFGSETDRTPGDMVVAAYDFDGNQKWLVKPGRFASVYGYCSSPVLFEDKLIVNGDHDGDAYIVALDKKTGETLWKVDRENKTRSYVTPIIRDIQGRTQMMLSGSKSVASYDPRTGKQQWLMDGPTEQFVASLVYDGKLVYLTAGFPERHILAVDPTGSGKLDDSAIVWRTKKGCGYVPSPVLCGEYLLVAADNGAVSCFQARSGELQWMERLGKSYSASLVSAGGLVYLLADDGVMKVVRPGPELDVVAENQLGEFCYASPAISQGDLFIRGEKSLFCIRGE
jgi:outer membrane protein assembly factor BamB